MAPATGIYKDIGSKNNDNIIISIMILVFIANNINNDNIETVIVISTKISQCDSGLWTLPNT